MTAGEIRALAARAGVGPGIAVLDVGCGIGGPGRFLTRELGCGYLGVDFSASAVAIAREQAGDLPCRFAIAHAPPLPCRLVRRRAPARGDARRRGQGRAGPRDRRGARPGGRFAFTLEEGPPLTQAERAAMPDPDTVWLTPLDELATSLERAGLVVTWQEDHSRAHRATAQALADAYAADAAEITAQIGGRALDELLAAHRLWVEWLDAGRVRKLALVAERGGRSEVERQLGAGPGAADEDPAVGRRLQRLDVVARRRRRAGRSRSCGRPRCGSRSRPARRRPRRSRAGWGSGRPTATARLLREKVTTGPVAGGAVRGVRRPVAGLDDAGAVGGDGAEDLGGDPLGRHAAGGERGADRPHERLGSADVVVGVRGDAQPVERRRRRAGLRGRGRCRAGPRRRAGCRRRRGGRRAARRGARRPRPRRRARRGCARRAATRPARVAALRHQRVEHREDRRGADAGADRARPGRVPVPQDEVAARRGDLEHVADLHARRAGSGSRRPRA